MTKNVHIACLMMVKNEKKRLHVTLKSLENNIDSLVIYDTGSTDNTIQILKDWSAKTNIPLRLKEGTFVDFSTSRNVALDFADTFDDIDFLLMCDVNDELQGGKKLREFAKTQVGTPTSAYLTCQHWWSGQYDKYYNMRFIKSRSGWRYRGRVHEWLKDTNSSTDQPSHPVIRLPDDIVLYQDRTQDDDKSSKRFKRDYELLLTDHKEDPQNARTVFYLAQTCGCLNLHSEALYYYKLRSTMSGFEEERFHSFLRWGDLANTLAHPWHDIMACYMKAVEHSERAEPYVKIAYHYLKEKKFKLATGFARMACDLSYPHEAILFVNKRSYDYERWHILGICAYYSGHFDIGEDACRKAIEAGINVELDKSNLKFYIDKKTEIQKIQHPILTKREFVDQKINELRNKFPHLKHKQLVTKANLLWKKKKMK